MKKIILNLFLITNIIGISSFFSCSSISHTHKFTNYTSDENATCQTDGTETAICDFKGCQEKNTKVKENSKWHKFENGNCLFCDAKENHDLTFTRNGESYVVTGIGNCVDTDLIIPETYNNIPVTSIDFFFNWGGESLEWCDYLTSITLSANIDFISAETLRVLSNIKCFEINNNNKSYSVQQGNLYSKDGSVLLKYSCGKESYSFIIPNNVEAIGYGAFFYCDKLTSITLPSNITTIGDYVFYGCRNLSNITFMGTITQWNKVEKGFQWAFNIPASNIICNNGKIDLL